MTTLALFSARSVRDAYTQEREYAIFLTSAILLHFLSISAASLWRHWGLLSSLNDLGVFDQVVWSLTQGYWFHNTVNQFNSQINWLGFHFNPILLLFVPLYLIHESPAWLLLVQSAALSLGALPIFLLARKVLGSPQAGLTFAVAYLANPYILSASAWDFHPVTLMVPVLAAGMLATETRNFRLLLAACLLLLVSTEHFGASVMGFGLLWGIRNRNWVQGLAVIFLGALQMLLVLGFIMPKLSPTGAPIMMSSDIGQLSRYSWLGKSITDALLNLALHPFAVAKFVLIEMGGWIYLTGLALTFAAFPLLAPLYLLPGAGDFAANLFSANSMPRVVFAYHSVTLIPILTAAAIYGVQRAHLLLNRSVLMLATIFFIVCVSLGYIFAPFPTPGSKNFWAPNQFINWPAEETERVREILRREGSLSAQSNVGAHFSQRPEIYTYPGKAGEAEHIVLHLSSPTTKKNQTDPGNFAGLGYHLQMNPVDYLSSVECLVSGDEYGILAWHPPWLILSRSTGSKSAQDEIGRKLDELTAEWGLEGARDKAADCRAWQSPQKR